MSEKPQFPGYGGHPGMPPPYNPQFGGPPPPAPAYPPPPYQQNQAPGVPGYPPQPVHAYYYAPPGVQPQQQYYQQAFHQPIQPQHMQQHYQQPPQSQVHVHGMYDGGARFDGIAQPNIPPPPPGCAPNAAQFAAAQGYQVSGTQKKNDFFTGGKGGGYTFW